MGNSWPTAATGPRGPSEKGSAVAWQGLGPRLLSALQAEGGCLGGARAGATARLGQRPAAISGHDSASKRAQEMSEEKASSVG